MDQEALKKIIQITAKVGTLVFGVIAARNWQALSGQEFVDGVTELLEVWLPIAGTGVAAVGALIMDHREKEQLRYSDPPVEDGYNSFNINVVGVASLRISIPKDTAPDEASQKRIVTAVESVLAIQSKTVPGTGEA